MNLAGGAIAGQDYMARDGPRQIFLAGSVDPRRDGNRDPPFTVPIVNDDVAEGTEYFEVHFDVDDQPNSGGYAFPSAIARVTIFDDDGGR